MPDFAPPDGSSTDPVSRNPATGAVMAVHAWDSMAAVEAALARAACLAPGWAGIGVETRAALIGAIGGQLEARVEALARSITEEMGKPLAEARAEVAKAAMACGWFAEHGPAMLRPEPLPLAPARAMVAFRPLGPVLQIAPWNFPVWQVFRAAIPALLAGNPVLLKHAPNVIGTARLIAACVAAAGAPPGLFGLLVVDHDGAGRVIADSRVRAVTFTGSAKAGARVAAAAAAALKPTILELGGSDAFVVLADADLAQAVPAAISARFANAGQMCIAAKRILLEAPIAAEFTARFLAEAGKLHPADPSDPATRLGPMARPDLRAGLIMQVAQSVAAGARTLLAGGATGPAEGCFYAPTVLGGVGPGMPVFDAEAFGPVACLTEVADAAAAIGLANASAYGLSGSIWTADVARAERLAAGWHTGSVFINAVPQSHPAAPIGGVKESGWGRELSQLGVRGLTNPQLVWATLG